MNPGLYNDISFEDYVKIDAVNASLLKNFAQSPAHVQYAKTHSEDSQALFIGRAVHCAVLEPDRFKVDFIVADCEKKNAKAYTTAVAANPTKTVLTKADLETINGIAESIQLPTHSQAFDLLKSESYNEITAIARNEETGLLCKCRADRYILDQDGDPIILDFKTTTDASPEGFSRAIANYSYHIQAAFYLDNFNAASKFSAEPKEHSRFIIIAAEKEPPYEIAVYEIVGSAIDAGREKYQKYLGMYNTFKDADVWPGYTNSITHIGIPNWAY